MRQQVTALVIDNLLSPAEQLRQCSALLAYNIGISLCFLRTNQIQDEEWVSELVAALCNAIEQEATGSTPHEENAMRLLAAIGFLLVHANEAVVELVQAVGLDLNLEVIMGKKYGEKTEWIGKLSAEILQLIQ